jgi:hypothetical protein
MYRSSGSSDDLNNRRKKTIILNENLLFILMIKDLKKRKKNSFIKQYLLLKIVAKSLINCELLVYRKNRWLIAINQRFSDAVWKNCWLIVINRRFFLPAWKYSYKQNWKKESWFLHLIDSFEKLYMQIRNCKNALFFCFITVAW